jgi:predicted ATPase
LSHRTGERYYQAELFRLKGELLLKQPTGRLLSRAATAGNAVVKTGTLAIASAERCFNQSIELAQQQKALSLELRAVTSMARLYQKHQNRSKQEEVKGLLAQICGKFTEGFDTMDFREAKALLDELS